MANKRRVLTVGNSADPHIEVVSRKLSMLGAESVFLDTLALGKNEFVGTRMLGGGFEPFLRGIERGENLLQAVDSVWLRTLEFPTIPVAVPVHPFPSVMVTV